MTLGKYIIKNCSGISHINTTPHKIEKASEYEGKEHDGQGATGEEDTSKMIYSSV